MKPGNDLGRASLAGRLAATNWRPSGFDYLRLGLAVSVVLAHSVLTTYGKPAHDALWTSPLRPLLRAIIPMFFALSGFLVAGSLERSKTTLSFIGLRMIRIYPALAVEVALSAFLIGAAVTTLPLTAYFRDPLFLSYLLNVIGDVHFSLPGVFENNPVPNNVNGQLWTVPIELLCYVTLTALVLLGGVRRRILIPLAALGLALGHLILRLTKVHGLADNEIVPFALLGVYFLAGVSLYLYRDKIAWSSRHFAGALIVSIPLLWFVPFGDYPAALTVTYVTVYLGLTNFKRLSFIKGADYSYGIYLYGSVIQQLFVYLAAPRFWWVNALVCVPASALFAAFSWHFIEKPAQNLRKPLAAAERHYLALKGRLLTRARSERLGGDEHRGSGQNGSAPCPQREEA